MSRMKLNMVTIMVSKFVTISLSMLAGILIARGFGVEIYGKYAVATIFLFFFYMVFDCGFDLSFISLTSKHREKVEEYFSNSIFLKVIVVIITFLSTIIITRYTGYSNEVQKLIVLLFIPIIVPVINATHLTYLQIQCKFITMSLMNVFRALLFLLATLVVIKSGGTLSDLAIAQSIATLVITGVFFMITRKTRFTFSVTIIRELLHEQRPFAVSALLTNLYLRTPLLYMTGAVASEQIALFDASNKITNSLQQGISSVDGSLIPSLFAAVKQGEQDKLNHLILEIFSFVAAIVLFCSSTIYFFADDIILLLYGVSFAKAATIMKILSVNLLIISFAPLFGTLIIAKGLAKEKTILQIISLLITVTAMLILIPKYGTAGVAITLTLSSAFLLISYLIYSHMKIRFLLVPLARTAANYILLMLITVACFYNFKTYLNVHFLVTITIGSILYLVGAVWLLKKESAHLYPLKATADE